MISGDNYYYTAGTISLVSGSRTVTGSGTSWVQDGLARFGCMDDILIQVSPTDWKLVTVFSLDSATQLTLNTPWPYATVSGVFYRVSARALDRDTRTLQTLGEVLKLGSADKPFSSLVIDDGQARVRFVGNTGKLDVFVGPTKTGTSETATTLAGSLDSNNPLSDQLADKLNLSGGELTGDLTLNGPPSLPNHAATKAYIDSGLSGTLKLVPANSGRQAVSGPLSISTGSNSPPSPGALTGAFWHNGDATYGLQLGVVAVNGRAWLQSGRVDGTNTSYGLSLNELGGDVTIGKTRFNAGDSGIEVGINGSGDRPAYIDLHASGSPGTIDFSTRFWRGAGANAWFEIVNAGSGGIALIPGPGGAVKLGSSGSGHYSLIARKDSADEGGELRLERPVTNSALGGDLGIDVWRDDLRIFESGGSFRGVFLRFSSLPSAVSSELIHSNNLRTWLVSGDTQSIGNYVLAIIGVSGVNFGSTVSGSSLRPAATSGATSGATSLTGVWRAHGYPPSGATTLFQRVA